MICRGEQYRTRRPGCTRASSLGPRTVSSMRSGSSGASRDPQSLRCGMVGPRCRSWEATRACSGSTNSSVREAASQQEPASSVSTRSTSPLPALSADRVDDRRNDRNSRPEKRESRPYFQVREPELLRRDCCREPPSRELPAGRVDRASSGQTNRGANAGAAQNGAKCVDPFG